MCMGSPEPVAVVSTLSSDRLSRLNGAIPCLARQSQNLLVVRLEIPVTCN